MLFQDVLIQRIIILCVFQTWPILYFLVLAYKLLKRKKSILTLTLSSYFIMNAFGYSLSYVSIVFLNTPIAYLIYLFTFYFTVYSQSFIVIFSWLLLDIERKVPYKIYYLLITIYGLIASYIFWVAFLFAGITYDSSTGWIPVFSIQFLVLTWIYLTIFLIGPQILLSLKLFSAFEGVKLKKRIKQFIISAFLEYATIYLLALYNTWIESTILRLIFPAINFVIGMTAAYYIYKSLGKELE
jgi:hypothetical protein